MYCIKCGKKISDGALFCEFCGSNQKEDIELSNDQKDLKPKKNTAPVSWYQLDRRYQKYLKKEFKSLYAPNSGLEVLAVICYIAGFITALFSVGYYTIKVLNETVASGTFISIPMLLITLFLFAGGTVAGLYSNHKFDTSFSQWLLTRNIIK